jgi:hypothetical protein
VEASACGWWLVAEKNSGDIKAGSAGWCFLRPLDAKGVDGV